MDMSAFSKYSYYVIKIVFYILALLIIINTFRSDILHLVKQIYRRSVFRAESKAHSRLYNHIDKVFFSLKGTSDSGRIYNFFFVTVALFAVSFFIMLNLSGPLFAVFFALLLSLMPYVLLRMRLYRIRVESSYDADKVVTEIANQYKICGFNMREAIRKSEKYLASAPFCRKHIYALALCLDTYKTDEELKKYLDYFVFSVDTQWAKMLSNNIYFAVVKNFNVVEGLSDILKDIKNSYTVAESSKRENSESVTMVFYLAPVMFFLSPFLANWIMGFPLNKYLNYQFRTPIGITLLTLILLGYFFCIFLIYFINRKKFDI